MVSRSSFLELMGRDTKVGTKQNGCSAQHFVAPTKQVKSESVKHYGADHKGSSTVVAIMIVSACALVWQVDCPHTI